MVVQITVQIDGREVQQLRQEVTGTAAEREEQAHRVGKEVGRVVGEEALAEAAAAARHPSCCGRRMENKGKRRVTLHGLDGELRVPRTRYRCRTCGRDVYAADGELKCGRHRVTRPAAKRACQLAAVEHFSGLPQLLFDQHGMRLSHEEVIELAHDVGGEADRQRRAAAEVWMATPPEKRLWPVPHTRPSRIYVSCDGIMYCTNLREPDPNQPGENRLIWQQMRVGCVYWEDEQGRWQKEMVWGRESAEDFGASLFRLACACGYRQAREKIFAADGADWCWNIHQRYFGDAEGILDWFHVGEHLWSAARALCPADAAAGWVDQAQAVLRDSGGERLWNWLQPQKSAARGKKREALQKLANYLQPRLDLMDYPRYRRHEWQIGTGMIESTARQLVGCRLKGPGMHWSEAGAIAVTALRAQSLNHHWHQFWNALTLNP
jgi:Uncharacterised protein family (UPF0236)